MTSLLNGIKPVLPTSGAKPGVTPASKLDSQFYTVDPSLWYRACPYRFVLYMNSGGELSMNLPIAPSNLQINTRMATTVIPTLYGIVEDHSSVRFYDIVIQGTTGIAPQYTSVDETGGLGKASTGRTSFDASSVSLGGFLPEVTNMVKQAKKIYSELSGTEAANESGFSVYNTGYYAFHSLYKFFLKYKDECVNGLNQENKASGIVKNTEMFDKTVGKFVKQKNNNNKANNTVRKKHPLEFVNFKDNQRYNVVPVSFTLNRNAENPMLYNYSIKLVAFNLQSANGNTDSEAEKAFQEEFKAQMGLNGLKGSTFSKFANKARTVSTVLSRIGIKI